MAERVQVVLKAGEKVRLKRQAQLEGTSLSAWLRRVALERLAEIAENPKRFTKSSQLRAFFSQCARAEQGRETEWDVQRDLIEQSRRSGGTRT